MRPRCALQEGRRAEKLSLFSQRGWKEAFVSFFTQWRERVAGAIAEVAEIIKQYSAVELTSLAPNFQKLLGTTRSGGSLNRVGAQHIDLETLVNSQRFHITRT